MRRVAVVLAAGIAACAPTSQFPTIDARLSQAEADRQREYALKLMLDRQERFNRVSSRIRMANVDLCPENKGAFYGVYFLSAGTLPQEYREAALRIGIHEQPTIVSVFQGTPADAAGLRRGDTIRRVDGTEIGHGAEAYKKLVSSVAAAAESGRPVLLEVSRGEAVLAATVSPVQACNYQFEIQSHDAVNAYADGKKVIVTTGMMRFINTDDELALILGHEMAHNTMGHIDKKQGNAFVGLLLGALITGVTGVNVMDATAQIGAGVHSQGFEAEADYVGLYMSARAGYDIDKVAEFWRRMAAENPKAISHGSSHPPTSERFVALDTAAAEIREKREKGVALMPNKGQPDVATTPPHTVTGGDGQ